MWIYRGDDVFVDKLATRIARRVGVGREYAEALHIARYGAGGQYLAHFDAHAHDTPEGRYFIREWGQRTWTALLYLSRVKSGGQTVFPKLDISITPEPGTLLIFRNCLDKRFWQHPLSLHAACPVKRGVKWTATLWFRNRRQSDEDGAARHSLAP